VETLADRIQREGPLNELDAVGWVVRLAKRLEALHSLGVAHGSVSTACVLTEGAARTSRGVLVDVIRTSGNVAFHSPERVRAGAISPADDTWALGVVLYSLLTGSLPFAGTNDDELKQRILTGAPAPLAVFDVGDDDLQRIVDDLFSRDTKARTSKVLTLRTELQKWHPDASVKDLSPVDDEDATDDGESTRMKSEVPARVVVRTADDFEDDDDDARTVLRDALRPDQLDEPVPMPGDKAPWAPTGRRAPKPVPPPAPPPPASGRAVPPPAPGRPAPPLPPPSGAKPPAAPLLLAPSDAPSADDNLPTQIVSAAAVRAEVARATAAASKASAAPDDEDDDDDIRTVLRPALGLEAMMPMPGARAPAPKPAAGGAAPQARPAPFPDLGAQGPPQAPQAPRAPSPPSAENPMTAAGTMLLSPEEQQRVAGALPPMPISSPQPQAPGQGGMNLGPFAAPPPASAAMTAPEQGGGGSTLKLLLLLLLLLVVTALVTFLFLSNRPV
jgi:hypothetical protein